MKFLTDRKLEARMHEIANYRYRDIISLEALLYKEDTAGVTNPTVPTTFEGWDTLSVGDTWKGRDLYLWLHKTVEIPREWIGRRVVGLFDYGNTGAGNNSGFESLLYINGAPYQGVDSNHKEAFLSEELIGTTVNFTFRLWSGLEGGGVQAPQEHRINRADIAWVDDKVDDLYYLTRIILETLEVLDDFDPIKTRLRAMLDEALKCIDWSYPGSEDFYTSMHLAADKLNGDLDGFDKHSLINVKCVGHTHIDVAWLWRLKHTREKCARSFSTVLRLMEQYPEYIFLQTQPQLYEYIKNDYPEIYAKIKEKVTSGQWEVDGGMWVEADCNLTSGESLTRQILVGSKFIKEEFGKDVEYLWLPDVFGYSWALPQILKKSGINMFMTTKISWNQYNRMPHDTFKWKGIDGSEVITHFITSPEPWSQPGSWFYTYNGHLTPKTVKGVWDAYSEKNLTDELLISYGYGDGGGGVNRDMLEYRRRVDKVPGLPNVKTGKAADYFRKLKEKVETTDNYVHTWDGELYLEYHRGTYTSQAYNKKMNRHLELLYRETEWLAAMDAIEKGDIAKADQEKLTEGWKIILCNQFHDIIPGSSINEVYKDCRVDYAKAENIALEVQKDALQSFVQENPYTYTILNNSSWTRTETIEIVLETFKGLDNEGVWLDKDGNSLEAQKQGNVWTVEVKNVPPMGWTTITFKEGLREELKEGLKQELQVNVKDDGGLEYFSFVNNHLETPFYSIDFNEMGQFTSLFDKENENEVLAQGQRGNVLQMFEDKPLAHEAWDIDIFYQEKMREVTVLQKIELVETGSLKAMIHLEWKYMSTTIKQDIIFYAKDRRIDFKTFVDWRERKQLLKVAFPVDIRATHATYDVQYGNVKRPTHWNTSWDWARFETVAQKWVDLSEYGYGVSLLNNCKYGHDIKDNVIRLTLLKAATHPDTEQDQGEHEFTYSLLPHKGGFVEGDTVKAAWALNAPLKVLEGKGKQMETSFMTLSNEHVELDAVKRSEDGNYLVVRFHEYTGAKQEVTLTFNFNIKGWMESDLMERPLEALREEEVSLKVKPYEIKTVLIKL